MSYSICRIAKIKATGVTGIQIHDRREKDGISHTNEDIDWTKTSENIDLLEQQERFRTVVNNRIAELELKRAPRSDATVMCQCLVTSDKPFFDKMSREEQSEYFKKSFEFIKERYGEKNLVSATIHYDERTPHMHVNFVPVTSDGRLSAKDLFSPKSLRELQNDYNRFVREHGYDLERGQIDSKTKHLEVEEYKIETRYEELKAKEQELEKLEGIDKAVGLNAEKGKILPYSTKEVEAIKKQNKALKVENHKLNNVIQGMKNELHRSEEMRLKAENRLQGTEVSLNRLKDLENENRALEHYKKVNPQVDKVMKNYDTLKEQAYSLGNKLAEIKEQYHNSIDDRQKLISQSYSLEKMAKDCDNKATDLSKLDKDISVSLARENALKSELEGLNGILKKKARVDCQKRLDKQESITKGLLDRLNNDHGTTPQYISHKLGEYAEQKQNFIKEKAEVMQLTDKVEKVNQQLVYNYKYHKALSDTQYTDFKEISDRINARVNLRPGEDKTFRLTQADRQQLLKDFEGKIDPRTIEKCKDNFAQQDVQERLAREQAKTITRSRGLGRER